MVGVRIEQSTDEACAVVSVEGEIDLGCAYRLESALAQVPADAPLILDTTGVEFTDSSGLYVIVRRNHVATANAARFIVVPSPAVERVFELAGVDHAIPTCPTLAEALTLLRDPAIDRSQRSASG